MSDGRGTDLFSYTQSGHIGFLTFYGDLKIQHLSELKAIMLKSLDRADHLVFNFDKVRAMDAACIQVILVMKRICAYLKKKLTVAGARYQLFMEILRREPLVEY